MAVLEEVGAWSPDLSKRPKTVLEEVERARLEAGMIINANNLNRSYFKFFNLEDPVQKRQEQVMAELIAAHVLDIKLKKIITKEINKILSL